MSYVIQVVLSNARHPEYGQFTASDGCFSTVWGLARMKRQPGSGLNGRPNWAIPMHSTNWPE